MSYKIIFAISALNDLEKIDHAIKKRLGAKLLQVAKQDDITLVTKPLSGDLAGKRRLRVGNYRVVFIMSGDVVEVLRIQHRREVYR